MCIRLYMYISLKIDKSQWCKKTYQVIAYSLIKKVSSKKYRHLICKINNTCIHTNAYQTTHARARMRARTQLVYTSYIQDDQGHLLLCSCLKSS